MAAMPDSAKVRDPGDGPAPTSRRAAIARVIVVSVVLLAGAEVVTRLALTSPSRQAFDEEMGWVWRPGSEVFNGKEGGARVAINELGLNDEAVTPVAPGGRRAVVLGNSFTEALQVAAADNFTSIAERLAPGWQIWNLGRSAMGPAHYPRWLDRFVPRLVPAVVIVALGPGDLDHLMGPQTAVTRGPTGAIASIALVAEAKDGLKRRFEPLLGRSALATYLMRRYKPAMLAWLEGVRRLLRVTAGDTADLGASDPLEPDGLTIGAAREEAVQRLAFILRDMARHAPVIVVDIPGLNYFHGRRSEPEAPAASAVYREAAARARARFVDAGPQLAAAFARTGLPPHGFPDLRLGTGHLNEVGHDAVAHALAAALRDMPARGPAPQEAQ